MWPTYGAVAQFNVSAEAGSTELEDSGLEEPRTAGASLQQDTRHFGELSRVGERRKGKLP
jgi:hypothetical protein